MTSESGQPQLSFSGDKMTRREMIQGGAAIAAALGVTLSDTAMLDVTADHVDRIFLADLQLDKRGGAAVARYLVELARIDDDVLRLSTVHIDHRGHLAHAAELLDLLTEQGSGLGVQG